MLYSTIPFFTLILDLHHRQDSALLVIQAASQVNVTLVLLILHKIKNGILRSWGKNKKKIMYKYGINGQNQAVSAFKLQTPPHHI